MVPKVSGIVVVLDAASISHEWGLGRPETPDANRNRDSE